MSLLGVYFGTNAINIVEAKEKKVLNNIQIPISSLASERPESKVPEELKIVALVKDELRKNRIEAKEAAVCLSGADLIIRTFDIPVLPPNELSNAINFEAKKYIPFKVEDLISGFQTQFDKANRRNSVLFVGIRKETLAKYLSILNQLDFKVNTIEYSGFSILRLVSLSGISQRGVVCLINTDSQKEAEADFIVTENGFPLFSRDIKLAATAQEQAVEDKAALLDKLKTEIRVSLDYYKRKYPLKAINQLFLIGSNDTFTAMEPLAQEIGLSLRLISAQKIIGKAFSFDLSFLKAYSAALSAIVRSALKINILSSWEKTKQPKEAGKFPQEAILALFSGFKLDYRILASGVLICAAALMFGIYQKTPLQKELNSLISSRLVVSGISQQASLEELTAQESRYNENLSVVGNLIKKQLYLTPQLSAIPALIPQGLWLENFSYEGRQKEARLALEGMAYLADSDAELALINDFLLALKKDRALADNFNDIKLSVVDTRNFKDKDVTHFIINAEQRAKR